MRKCMLLILDQVDREWDTPARGCPHLEVGAMEQRELIHVVAPPT